MGLLNLFKKKDVVPPKERNTNEVFKTDDLTHLTSEGELPWGWHSHNKDFIEKINNEYTHFLNMWLDSKKQEPKKQYEALKSYLLYIEDVEKLCKSKGECFEVWFNELLPSPIYLEEIKEELANLTENFDEIEKNYKKREKELANLDERIVTMLKDNPGILQADFVKLFDPIIQNEVKEKLYYMDKSCCLQRIKTGRSYTLNYRG